MPTMTNPETGETKEISMEEFLKMMRSGNGSLQQVVTHADGTTSSTTLYGNVAQDGLDRSVNIFVDNDTFNAFIVRKIKKLTGEMDDPESEKDPGELYEMTIDFTDSAIMGILKATDKELSINLYTRDERKATYDHLKQGSKSWKVNPDKTIEFSGADLQGEDKTVSLYMLAFLEMRQFLRATGKLAELKKLGNCGSGVIIKATGQAEDAQATIVRGRNRPDLPCEMFLLGEQMMRPYMDEMMSDAMMSGMSLEEKIEAAEGGDPDIMEHLAQMYLNGDDDVAQDFEKSAYWWEKLANTGNATGQFNLGLYYAKGCGVKRDFAKATEWMKKSAENGDEDAPAAAELYDGASGKLKKAEAGDPVAQAEMAKLYTQLGGSLEQFGTQQDYDEAFKWAKKAADQGNLDGMYCLALCYEHGRGTPVAKTKAAMTYEKAANLGHAPSQWNLAVCYLNGSGYERNEVKGYMWAYQAADQGNELAINGLSYQEKTIEQIIDTYKDSETNVTLEGTQYEGRADRCEYLKVGTELTYKISKDKNNDEVIELFYNGGTVGLLSKWNSAALLALLKLDRIQLVVKVKSCIPKSKRGARARNADVHLNLIITEKKPETPEERAKRLAEEEAQRKAEEERKRLEAEAKKRKEEERKRKEEEAARLKQEKINAWNAEVAEVEKKRKAERELRVADIDTAEVAAKSELMKLESEEIVKTNEDIAVKQNELNAAASELNSLGMFKFSRKRELRDFIAKTESDLSLLKNKPDEISKEYAKKRDAIKRDTVNKKHSLESQLEKQFPLPEHPYAAEIAAAKAAEEAAQRKKQQEEAQRKHHEELKKKVFDVVRGLQNLGCRECDIRIHYPEVPQDMVKPLLDELVKDKKIRITREFDGHYGTFYREY